MKSSFIPAFTFLILSAILLTIPGNKLPKENWLDKIWLDKWVHIGMFAILVILWCRALRKNDTVVKNVRTIFIGIGFIGLAYGIGMEFIQKYCITNRSFDLGDIIADGIGSAFGVLFSLKRYIKK